MLMVKGVVAILSGQAVVMALLSLFWIQRSDSASISSVGSSLSQAFMIIAMLGAQFLLSMYIQNKRIQSLQKELENLKCSHKSA